MTKPFTGWVVKGWPILEKYDEATDTTGLQIYGSRYSRGTRAWAGGTPMVGYELSCTACDWNTRVNGPLSEARPTGKDHAREVHGVRGMESV